MNYSKSVQFLLDHACPSIVYRTRKEILGESSNTPSMQELQKQVQNDPEVKRILALQKEDGWLGGHFHGADGPEGGIRYLYEKGVESDHPVIQRAIEAIELLGKDFDYIGLGRIGMILDDYHLGGIQMMKACTFAYAGHEKETFFKDQIEEALSAFDFVANLLTIDNVYTLHKNKILVFAKEVKWPSTYHLRLLALTHSWRNTNHLGSLYNAFNKLVEFSPIPNMKLLHKNQVVGPASIFMNDFNPDLRQINAKEWMMWFHRTEMIARLGIIEKVEAIKNQVQILQNILYENEGLFIKPLSHFYFNKWTQYIGLALENDWKAKNASICDLTFRSLLILKLTNQLDL
jgi:hypothetical protein